jgi:hypothetical protein
MRNIAKKVIFEMFGNISGTKKVMMFLCLTVCINVMPVFSDPVVKTSDLAGKTWISNTYSVDETKYQGLELYFYSDKNVWCSWDNDPGYYVPCDYSITSAYNEAYTMLSISGGIFRCDLQTKKPVSPLKQEYAVTFVISSFTGSVFSGHFNGGMSSVRFIEKSQYEIILVEERKAMLEERAAYEKKQAEFAESK